MYTGYKFALDMIRTESLSKYSPYILDQKFPTRERVAAHLDPLSDEYMDEYIKSITRTVWHPVGTCKMGARGDKTAVVDTELR